MKLASKLKILVLTLLNMLVLSLLHYDRKANDWWTDFRCARINTPPCVVPHVAKSLFHQTRFANVDVVEQFVIVALNANAVIGGRCTRFNVVSVARSMSRLRAEMKQQRFELSGTLSYPCLCEDGRTCYFDSLPFNCTFA